MGDILSWSADEIQRQLASNQFLSGGLALAGLGALVAWGRFLPGRVWQWFLRRIFIEFEIQMQVEAFYWFSEWLSAHPYSSKRARFLSVMNGRNQNAPVAPGYLSQESSSKPLVYLAPAPGIHWLVWRRRLLIVTRTRQEQKEESLFGGRPAESYIVRMLFGGRKELQALLNEAHDAACPPEDDRVGVLTWSGHWAQTMRRRPRTIESVILAEGVAENLLDDVSRFLRSEAWYVERGLPYRRGYLLHGPPGNGKTSTIAAIASTLHLNVCVLNLASKTMGDDALRDAMSQVPEKCIVLIEDIDCIFQQRTGSGDKDNSLTFSGLLNAIDGVATADGRILFMTTNYLDNLDEALVRPGRCDVKVLIDNPTRDQVRQLFVRFFPDREDVADDFVDSFDEMPSMATVQAILLAAKDDPSRAIERIAVAA